MRDLPLPTFPLSELSDSAAMTRRSLHRRSPMVARPRLEVAWARDEVEVREAQRLRYQVFAIEMGARLSIPRDTPPEHDVDLFDPYCEHLLVRAPSEEEGRHGPVVGTYRVLTPAGARRIGGLYSETEFDLTRLRPLRERTVELGRSCVHADWRAGGAIMALWGALAEFMMRNHLDTMIGCASISMRDGGHMAASIWRRLKTFVKGLRKDEAAIVAALTLEWSNGPVEGQVNRLKLIKRQMYGRANFDLLRQRVVMRL
jgi:putative hemolysin